MNHEDLDAAVNETLDRVSGVTLEMPVREKVISDDDVLNLRIDLETMTVDEFLAKI